MAAFRATLWNNIESVLDSLHNKCLEVLCLQQVLCKKRDGVTHLTFFEILAGSNGGDDDLSNVLRHFWSGAVAAVARVLVAATAESNFLKQALEGEYPKLLRLFNDLWARLHQVGSDLRVEGAEPGGGGLNNPLASQTMDSALREALTDLER